MMAQFTAWWPWLIAIVAGVAALFFAWWVWWRLPKRQVDRFPIDDAKARADVEDNFRKTIGQLIGGAGLLIGAGIGAIFAICNSRKDSEIPSNSSQHSRKIEQQQKASREPAHQQPSCEGILVPGSAHAVPRARRAPVSHSTICACSCASVSAMHSSSSRRATSIGIGIEQRHCG